MSERSCTTVKREEFLWTVQIAAPRPTCRLHANSWRVPYQQCHDAITNFLTPSSCTDLHSFICLTNEFMTCTKEFAPALTSLWLLLSTHNDFRWTPDHDIAFHQAKQLLTAPLLAYFDPSKETHLHMDASTLSLGFLPLRNTEVTTCLS